MNTPQQGCESGAASLGDAAPFVWCARVDAPAVVDGRDVAKKARLALTLLRVSVQLRDIEGCAQESRDMEDRVVSILGCMVKRLDASAAVSS